MLRVTLLPARFGDSILVEYGREDEPHRVLIDGGTGGTRRDIRRLLGDRVASTGHHLELLVITHVDRDHIEGVLGLLEEADESLRLGDVWFNGWGHLPDNPDDERFGAVQGERLSRAILDLGLPWNREFDGRAVALGDGAELPRRTLPGGLDLTILAPTTSALARLKPVWAQEVRAANLDPGFGLEPNDEPIDGDEQFGSDDPPDVEALAESPFEDDRSAANGSSIAFLAEFEGRRVLFAADAPAGALAASLARLSPEEPVALDLFKISHHGSRNTTSRELIEKVRCPTFAFSTSGSIFKHPHHEAVARTIVAGGEEPELVFNYRSRRNEIWDLRFLKRRHRYTTRYPDRGTEGLVLSL